MNIIQEKLQERTNRKKVKATKKEEFRKCIDKVYDESQERAISVIRILEKALIILATSLIYEEFFKAQMYLEGLQVIFVMYLVYMIFKEFEEIERSIREEK